MKVKYTPGENGLVGKTYNVEIVKLDIVETNYIKQPILESVTIKYEDGKKETISGMKFFDSINMIQKSVTKRMK